jgi:hypothetical protein
MHYNAPILSTGFIVDILLMMMFWFDYFETGS